MRVLQNQGSFFMHMNEVLKNRRIVIQGISGSFHEIAAQYYFDQSIEIIPANTFEELIALAQK